MVSASRSQYQNNKLTCTTDMSSLRAHSKRFASKSQTKTSQNQMSKAHGTASVVRARLRRFSSPSQHALHASNPVTGKK